MTRPNILWITTDQQRFDTLGCYGNEFVLTPNIDKLAQTGTLFEAAYCQSTVCTPSRASFLTGRYPSANRMRKNGQNIPESEVLVTRLLDEAGYSCGLSGKLHLSSCHPTVCHGTERRIQDGYSMFHWSHGPNDDWPTNEYAHWLREKGKKLKRRPVDGSTAPISFGPDAEDHQAAWCAEKAINFIEAHEGRSRPWLFSVNIYAPHVPFDPPESHYRRYEKMMDQIPLPNYWPGETETKSSFLRRDHLNKTFNYPKFSDTDHRNIKAAYWAMVDLIDEQVGRMINALERTGQLDNTIIIFTSDHGELLGDHGVYLKGQHFYEPSIHVPLILSYPGHTQSGTRQSSLVELIDLAPTLLEAAGLPVYPGMQGKSLWPLLRGEADRIKDEVYCEVDESTDNEGYAVMVRTEKAKIVLYHTAGDGELYDLENDPGESRNLWNDKQAAELKLSMMERLCHRLAGNADRLPAKISPW